MAKVLLGRHNIEGFIDRKSGYLIDDGNLIIPPGMKDFLQTEGITVRRCRREDLQADVSEQKAPEKNTPARGEECFSRLAAKTAAVLQSEYGIKDEETLQRLCLLVMEQLNQ